MNLRIITFTAHVLFRSKCTVQFSSTSSHTFLVYLISIWNDVPNPSNSRILLDYWSKFFEPNSLRMMAIWICFSIFPFKWNTGIFFQTPHLTKPNINKTQSSGSNQTPRLPLNESKFHNLPLSPTYVPPHVVNSTYPSKRSSAQSGSEISNMLRVSQQWHAFLVMRRTFV